MQASFERLVSVSIKVNLVILTVRHLIKISVSHLTHGPCCYLSLWAGLVVLHTGVGCTALPQDRARTIASPLHHLRRLKPCIGTAMFCDCCQAADVSRHDAERCPVNVHSSPSQMSYFSRHWYSYFLVACFVSSQYAIQDAIGFKCFPRNRICSRRYYLF